MPESLEAALTADEVAAVAKQQNELERAERAALRAAQDAEFAEEAATAQLRLYRRVDCVLVVSPRICESSKINTLVVGGSTFQIEG